MDGPPPQEEDFTSIPVADRLVHKNWKARVSAYESLIKSFQASASDSDPVFKPYINNPDLLKKIATDSNAVAQEKGVECLVAFREVLRRECCSDERSGRAGTCG
ncbi:hypothetical protein QCA50_003146 [Cerrena zonata]|uniref:XMAP215/Dis1/CLASP TOG domain-containing protein n=1 Tax=Cerrena zonata TaxID=2478898 RepID=A0AAW0GLR4_9APHY